MAGESVHLQFTQPDRDMIRDTHGDVKQILETMKEYRGEVAELRKRVEVLEKWQTRVIAVTSLGTAAVMFVLQRVWK